MKFPIAKPGDFAIRNLAGVEIKLRISKVADDKIICGSWAFDRQTGAEIDDFLEWGPRTGRSGSFLTRIEARP